MIHKIRTNPALILAAIVAPVLTMTLGTCSKPPTILDEVLASGELRVITRASPTSYYLGRRGAEGPEYDLAKGFATFLGVDLKLEVADRFFEILPAVESGRVHLAAAGLAKTPAREARLAFGPVYQRAAQHLVYLRGTGKPRSIDDLDGKRIEVMAGTSFVESLQNMRGQKPDLRWIENPVDEVSDMLVRVADGALDYTLADSTEFAVYRNYLPELRVAFDVAIGDEVAWAFPDRTDTSLIDRAAQYFAFLRESGTLDRIFDRYYGHRHSLDYVGSRAFIRHFEQRLPRFRSLFDEAAEEVEMDWRLLAAIGYQESHWNPEAVSPTGVRGIMMLTEPTAAALGIENRTEPSASISGGARYFSRLKSRLPEQIREPDRTWIALAAYNVGLGHVYDAREITVMRGGNPNRWLDVRQSLPLLAQRKWHSQVRRGYARGWEPVRYVQNIRNYYDVLVWLTTLPEVVDPGLVTPDGIEPEGEAMQAAGFREG